MSRSTPTISSGGTVVFTSADAFTSPSRKILFPTGLASPNCVRAKV
jgi:hypothetical protein